MPTLQSLGVEPITIEGLTIEGLREWVENEKGVTLHDNILSRALLVSGGRPGPLRAWINNGVFTLDSLEAPDMNNYGFYRELFNRLEPESQYALRILGSLSYSMQIDVSMLANFLQINEQSAARVIHELALFRLIDRSGRIIRLNNRQFAEYLRSDSMLPLPPNEIRNILSIMEQYYGSIEPRHNTYSLVDTKKDLLMISTDFVDYDYLVDVAKRQYDDGAYRSARRIANEILTRDRLLSDTHSYGFRIVSAQACDQLGLYDEGIEKLSAVRYETLPVQDKTKYNIVLGKLHFRLNDYRSACVCISRAESLTEETGDAESNAKCRIYRAHIHRDTEQYEAAYEVAIQLQKDLMTRVSPLTSAHIHRSTSRAMSSLADRGSIDEAQKSIEIAITEYSKVDEGNGYFALGEAFRLNKEYGSSIPAYHKGLDIALSLENKDLEIYCRLGLVASFLGAGDVDSASSNLCDLSILSYDKFPIETLHFKLLSHVVDCLKSPTKDRDTAVEFISVYEARYNRQATRRFVDSLHAIDTTPERFYFIENNPIMF